MVKRVHISGRNGRSGGLEDDLADSVDLRAIAQEAQLETNFKTISADEGILDEIGSFKRRVRKDVHKRTR